MTDVPIPAAVGPSARATPRPLTSYGPRHAARPSDLAEEPALLSAAVEFEAMFLAEMLKDAGLGRAPESFGGGPGEDAFGSLLVGEQARLLARRGGIGLAERIYRSLLARRDPR